MLSMNDHTSIGAIVAFLIACRASGLECAESNNDDSSRDQDDPAIDFALTQNPDPTLDSDPACEACEVTEEDLALLADPSSLESVGWAHWEQQRFATPAGDFILTNYAAQGDATTEVVEVLGYRENGEAVFGRGAYDTVTRVEQADRLMTCHVGADGSDLMRATPDEPHGEIFFEDYQRVLAVFALKLHILERGQQILAAVEARKRLLQK